MSGTEYVIEQLGQALEQAHAVIGQQQQQIAELEAEVAARRDGNCKCSIGGANTAFQMSCPLHGSHA